MVKLPSASRLSLAMKCAGSFILPQVKSEPGEQAKRGTAKHALVENYINSQRTIPEDLGEEERTLLRNIGILLGPPAEVFERPELAVAVYPDDHSAELYSVSRRTVQGKRSGTESDNEGTHIEDPGDAIQRGTLATERQLELRESDLRVLGTGGGLDVPVEDEVRQDYGLLFRSNGQGVEVPSGRAQEGSGPDRLRSFLAIADLVRKHDEGTYSVIDWKTGSSYVPPPQWNWQLILPAIGLWICSGKRTDFTCNARIVRLEAEFTTGAQPESYVYDNEFLQRSLIYLERLYRTAQSKDASNVDLYEGKHCVFCPARDRCPAKVGAMGLIAASVSASSETGDMSFNNELEIMRVVIGVTETSAMRKKAGESILEAHGGVFNLGDGREAVLDKSGKRSKIYTRKAKRGQEEGSNASEDGEPGTEGEGAGADSEGGA